MAPEEPAFIRLFVVYLKTQILEKKSYKINNRSFPELKRSIQKTFLKKTHSKYLAVNSPEKQNNAILHKIKLVSINLKNQRVCKNFYLKT